MCYQGLKAIQRQQLKNFANDFTLHGVKNMYVPTKALNPFQAEISTTVDPLAASRAQSLQLSSFDRHQILCEARSYEFKTHCLRNRLQSARGIEGSKPTTAQSLRPTSYCTVRGHTA